MLTKRKTVQKLSINQSGIFKVTQVIPTARSTIERR